MISHRRWRAATAAVLAVLLMTGCDEAVQPASSTPMKDRATYATTRSEIDARLTEAVESAMSALKGSDLNGAERSGDTTCGEPSPYRFRLLESKGSFLGTSGSVAEAVEMIRAGWVAKGWKVETVRADALRMAATTSTDVGFRMYAEVRPSAKTPGTVVVSLDLASTCLELPDSVVSP